MKIVNFFKGPKNKINREIILERPISLDEIISGKPIQSTNKNTNENDEKIKGSLSLNKKRTIPKLINMNTTKNNIDNISENKNEDKDINKFNTESGFNNENNNENFVPYNIQSDITSKETNNEITNEITSFDHIENNCDSINTVNNDI